MPGGRENTVSQMKELIYQNINHPSIIVWGLSNEITMNGASDSSLIENHRMLNDLVHKIDPTRPTTIAVLSMCDPGEEYVRIPDVLSYNHYFGCTAARPICTGRGSISSIKNIPTVPSVERIRLRGS